MLNPSTRTARPVTVARTTPAAGVAVLQPAEAHLAQSARLPVAPPASVTDAVVRLLAHEVAVGEVALSEMAQRKDKTGIKPWEDVREVAVPTGRKLPVKALGDAWLFEGPKTKATLDTILRDWGSTSQAALWTTPLGQAVAAFAISRYATAATQFDGRGKLKHVVEVLNNADRIVADQATHGVTIAKEWREALEYGALFHDAGYMNGGFMHPKKGGNDLLANFRAVLQARGVAPDAISDVQLERIALVVTLHGDAFPWGQVGDEQDKRRLAPAPGEFGDFPYLALPVVDEIFAHPHVKEEFVALLQADFKEYIRATGGMKLLEDPAELQALIHTGYIMHAADKYKGPRGSLLSSRAKEIPGVTQALTSIEEADRFVRRSDIKSALNQVSQMLSAFVKQLIAAAPEKGRDTFEQKVIGGLIERLELVGDLVRASSPDLELPVASLAASVRAVADSSVVKDASAEVAELPKIKGADAQALVSDVCEHAFRTPDLTSALSALIQFTAARIEAIGDVAGLSPAPSAPARKPAAAAAAPVKAPASKAAIAAQPVLREAEAQIAALHEAILSSVPASERAVFEQQVVTPVLDELAIIAGALANASEQPSLAGMSALLAAAAASVSKLDALHNALPVNDAEHDAPRLVGDAAHAVLGTRALTAGVSAVVAKCTNQIALARDN